LPFVKLDTRILQSTLWFERDARELFITALLMAEPCEIMESTKQLKVDAIEYTGFEVPPGWYGFVPAAGIGIIRQAGMEREPGMKALADLGNPDIESRSADYEGRRLVRVDGGFVILNYIKYRERDTTVAERMRRYRKRQKELHGHNVTLPRHVTQAEAEADVEVEADKDQKQSNLVSSASSDPPHADDGELVRAIQIFEESPVTKGNATKADRETARRLLRSHSLTHIENGILLATARKIASDRENGSSGQVQSLAYFEQAIAEAAADKNLSESYMQRVRQVIRKHGKNGPV
jgi:hypothetical protein